MEVHTEYTEDSIDLFQQPARIIIAGYSNSGKSQMCSNLINKYHYKFNTILYFGVNSHKLQNNPDIKDKLHISSEIVNPFDYTYDGNTLYILDNCFLEANESKFVVNAFTKGRHENISTIFITQNLFFSGKFERSIPLNCSHYILMRNRDLGQIEVLGRQLFGKQIYRQGIGKHKFIKFKYFIFLKVIQVSQGNIKICREDGQQTYPH